MDKLIELITTTLDEHKVEDVVTIDVSNRTPFSTHYILGTCGNARQLGAISEYIEDALAKEKLEIRKIDGTPESGWIVIDEGTVMIHLFTKEAREKILLEELLSKK